jgi:hypothetical protein
MYRCRRAFRSPEIFSFTDSVLFPITLLLKDVSGFLFREETLRRSYTVGSTSAHRFGFSVRRKRIHHTPSDEPERTEAVSLQRRARFARSVQVMRGVCGASLGDRSLRRSRHHTPSDEAEPVGVTSLHKSPRFISPTAKSAARAVSAIKVSEGFTHATEVMQAPSVIKTFFAACT